MAAGARLEGKVAIVTGASRGTGAAIARRLVADGARVVLGDVQDERGRALAQGLGAAAVYHRLDVTSENDWGRAIALALDHFGRLDALVNNAALRLVATLEDTVPQEFKRVLDVNLFGPFLGIRAVAETLRHAGGGSIVNVASIDALEGANGVSAWASSKWGLRGLTKCAALELGAFGVRVNTICPGASRDPAPTERKHDEVAALVAYLISDGASGITGTDVPADARYASGRSTS